ncbi:hypothetical protein J2Z37_001125 [Ammoniphilus resinae]|uniref:Uncharacterized protein n=1 Tax=Ammoniphilus resinae TaxID=861532 RepID=A0ABS4GLJ5_9BACL|nr:hypothetical protein [Ammoniphilus resinae]
MVAIIVVLVCLNVLALFSIFLLRKYTSIFEITGNIFFISTVFHIGFSILTLNTKRIVLSETPTVFWILELNRIIFIPCLLIWVLVFIFHPKFRAIQKLIIFIWWFVLMVGLEKIYRFLHFIEFRNWNEGYSLIKIGVIFALCLIFMRWFRGLIKKEEMR